MSNTAREAVREAAGKHIHRARPAWHDNGVGIVQGSHYRAGFIDGAEWQASQQPAPEDVGEAIAATKSLLRMLDELDPHAFAAEARENLPRIWAMLDVGD